MINFPSPLHLLYLPPWRKVRENKLENDGTGPRALRFHILSPLLYTIQPTHVQILINKYNSPGTDSRHPTGTPLSAKWTFEILSKEVFIVIYLQTSICKGMDLLNNYI